MLNQAIKVTVGAASYANIAEFLDVTETAVQGRLQRARAKLRKELKMVEDAFQDKELPESFSTEIKHLIDTMISQDKTDQHAAQQLAEIGAPAVDPLCKALEDPRRAVRQAAACVLCRIGDERALHPLLRLLYADDAWAYYKVFSNGKALAIPGLQEELIKIVQSDKPVARGMVIQALSYAAEDEKVYDCIAEAFEQHPEVRIYVLMGLMWNKVESLRFFLIKALETQDPSVMNYAIWIASSKSIQIPIESALKAFSEKLSPGARIGAGNLILNHREKGIKVLERVMRTGSAAERSIAAIALARSGHDDACDVLKQDLNTKQKDREWTAAISSALIRYYDEDLLSQIQEGKYRTENHHAIIWGVAKSRISQPTGTLNAFFSKGTPAIRVAALRMLAHQKGKELLPQLRLCLRKGSPRKVAQEAFNQMLKLGDEAMPTVQEMLKSEHWPERKAAIHLLKRWEKLLPAQEELARSDQHIAVRHAVL